MHCMLRATQHWPLGGAGAARSSASRALSGAEQMECPVRAGQRPGTLSRPGRCCGARPADLHRNSVAVIVTIRHRRQEYPIHASGLGCNRRRFRAKSAVATCRPVQCYLVAAWEGWSEVSDRSHDDLPFERAGSWRLLRTIGRGGTATVYEGVGSSGQRAAIKVLHRALALDEAWWRRVQREASLLKLVDHPGLPRVYEVGRAYGVPFLALELLEGRSLEARLAEGPLSSVEVSRYAVAALDVLAAVHAAGGVHRDLKPSNLFETRNGTLKVVDFGIAGRGGAKLERSSITRGVFGTPAYMSPEQARGRWSLVDERADLWALGAVMFLMLTGEYVHPAATENERLAQAMIRSARPLASVLPNVEPRLASIVDRALAYEREDRWQSAAAFRAALVGSEPITSMAQCRESALTRGKVISGAPRAFAFFVAVVAATAMPFDEPPRFNAITALPAARTPRQQFSRSRQSQAVAPDTKLRVGAAGSPALPAREVAARPRPKPNTTVRRAPAPPPDPLDQRMPLLRPRLAQTDSGDPLNRYR
jgi:eukaryotic-like serine/threonine-protein kinase